MDKRILLLFLSFLFASCAAPPTPTSTPPRFQKIATTSALEANVVEWLTAYASEEELVSLHLDILSPVVLLEAVEKGEVEALIIAREPPEGWFATPLYREGIAVVVHPENRITSLTQEQLANIFSGRVRSWTQVGGDGEAVQPVIPLPGDPVREKFMSAAMRDLSMTPTAMLGATPQSLQRIVSENPGAVGLAPASQVSEDVRVVPLDGRLPDTATVREGSYSLWMEVLVTAPSEPSGPLRDFLVWLQEDHFPSP
jgi:hypothetical protein